MLRQFTVAAALLLPLITASCDADNCLRAFRATQTPGRLSSAQAFCATFTASTVTATTGLPTYATPACTGNVVSRVSSACSCIAPASTTSIVSTPGATAGACATVSSLSAAQKVVAPSGKFGVKMTQPEMELRSSSYAYCASRIRL